MKLKFFVSKTSNHFFYISMMTGWNNALFRKETIKEWKEFLEDLNLKEKQVINQVGDILEKYKKNKGKWLQNIFYNDYTDQKIWLIIKQEYSKEEYDVLKQAFKITKSKFDKLWKRIDVLKVRKFLKQLESKYYQKLFDEINTFFGIKNTANNFIKVAVLPIVIKEGLAGHAWNNEKANVNIEFSMVDVEKNNIQDLALLLSHEIFHLLFRQSKFLNIFKEEISNNKIDYISKKSLVLNDFYQRPFVLVEESLVVTFCDFYYLRMKYYQTDKWLYLMTSMFDKQGNWIIKDKIQHGKYIDRDLVLGYIGYKMLPIVLEYIINKKPVDRNLIKLFILQVKELLKLEKKVK